MHEAVPVGKGKMIAILGSTKDEILNLIKLSNKEKKICEIANDNSDGQLIVSGNTESVDFFINFLKEKKIKFIPLKVSAPFHCSLMKPAAEIMKDKIYNTNFTNPIYKIVSNVTAKPETDVEKIKDLLIKQIYTTVRWRESIITMHQLGVKILLKLVQVKY